MIKPKPFVALATLVVALYFFAPHVKSFIQRPAQKIIYHLQNTVHKTTSWTSKIAAIPSLLAKSSDYQRKILLLQRSLIEMNELRLENERLRRLVKFKEKSDPNVQSGVVAEVVGRSVATWYSSILINKGYEDGIRKDMPVVTVSGLIGKVSDTGSDHATVNLLTHPSTKIGAIIQRTRDTGVVYGRLDDEIRMKYIALDSDVRKGDIVETAGFSRMFPKGLPIGFVQDVWKETGQVYKVASIKPYADINRLEEVICVQKP